jgi:hypothetical protein
MPASRYVVSVLLWKLGDLSPHPQGRPCGRPPAAAVLGLAPERGAVAGEMYRTANAVVQAWGS